MAQKTFLTGDRPTGPLHIGHYFGSLQNRVALQNKGYKPYIIIADYQVLTDRLDSSKIAENIINLTTDYLSVGLDPEKTTIFVQSQIPELTELTTVFSMLATMSRVSRNPTVKEEVRAMNIESSMSLGMFSYPVSQAADILLPLADVVPVGEDQLPHIELTREIAHKFNTTYAPVFPIPEPLLSKTPRLPGLDGKQKMSKSRGNAIFLSDDDATVMKKIKAAVTDSDSVIRYAPVEKMNVSALMDLFTVVSGVSPEQQEKDFAGKGYGDYKKALIDVIIAFLTPIREKRKDITPDVVANVLTQGNAQMREKGIQTMKQVREAMHMNYPY